MKKPKVMILGAAKFTVPIIEISKQMGFETIVVSIAGDYPGFAVADTSYEVDVRDKDTILDIAIKEGICGVVTDQTDLPVPTVAYIAERMGLPGIGYECALRISDKLMSRQHCQKFGFPVPEFVQAVSLEEATRKAGDLGFPLVVKPTDAMAARGVAKVDDWSDFAPKFQHALACSAKGVVLLEKFFEGKKIGVVGFKSGSHSVNLIMFDHEHFNIPGLFIIRQTLTPSNLDARLQNKIWDFHERLFDSYEAAFGFTFSELKVNEKNGEFCLIESAIRGPGGFISSHLVPLACGVDFLPILLEIATGRRQTVVFEKSHPKTRAAGNIYFYLPAGVICQMKGIEEVKALPGVHRVELDGLGVGKKVEPPINLNGRQGPIVYSGKDRQVAEEIVKTIMATFEVQVETPDGKKGMIWF
jgi:biotin carboxylase